jgi:outer membrane protein assembly factor BamB
MRSAVRILFALPILCGGMTAALAATPSRSVTPVQLDWHQFRFDQAHTGFNRFEHVLNVANVPSLGNTWQAQLGDIVFSSSPAVVGGVVYIGSMDGTLWAYPADGCGADLCETPLWQSTNLAQIIDSPTVADGIVYVGSQTSFDSNDGRLSAFDARGCGAPVCAPLWQGAAGKESILESSAAVGGGFVYVGAFDGRLYAFNARGCGRPLCRPVWTGATGGTIESSPTVIGGVVYIGSDEGKLYAFAAGGCGRATCAPLWTGDLGSAVFESTPAVANGIVYISSQHALSAFDAHGCGAPTCAPLWQAVDEQNFFSGSPAIAYGRVYAGLESGIAVYAADGCGAAVCPPLWLLFGAGFQAAVESSPTVANGVVYAGRNTGEVLAWPAEPCGDFVCLNIWSGLTREVIVNSSPTVIDGKLYIGSADNAFPEQISGRVYVFELQ